MLLVFLRYLFFFIAYAWIWFAAGSKADAIVDLGDNCISETTEDGSEVIDDLAVNVGIFGIILCC
mgnify:CR=1 FL=1